MKQLFGAMALAALLVACTERPQTIGDSNKDSPPYAGTGKAYTVSGWKQGDKASWESQLKARTQQGQNDYGRMN